MAEEGSPEVDEASDAASEIENDPEKTNVKDEENSTMAEQKLGAKDRESSSQEAAPVKKYDPKDPLRPRRKKARRACFACQRAHLTCGDERPCQRCIKRGLADACQDGVRKKAKYLHDAPPEALRPVLGPAYNPPIDHRNNGPHTSSTSASDTSPNSGGFFPPNPSPPYPMFQGNRQGTMPPPLQDPMAFNNQQTPISPTYQTPTSHRPGSMQSLTGSLLQPSPDMPTQNNFGTPFFDPGTSGNFNFDLEGLNFGNHYGALEFGMLGHMSSGVAETPPQDNGHMGHQSGDIAFNTGVFGNGVQYGQMYNTQDTLIPEFSNGGLFGNDGMQQQHPMPNAFAIAACTTSVHSPSTENSPQASTSFDSSPTTTYTPPANINNSTHNMPGPSVSHAKQAATKRSMDAKASQKTHGQSLLHKRKRDPSMVYETVHEPYPYTAGFHSLIAFIQRRFSPNKTLRIAKSLASIRPSFISCTKTLSHYDLIFMEKCFQRTLFEYEEFMVQCCTPTVVCRRTGEIAAVNKEFTLLTGWTRDVLLGKEANLNVNTGNNASTNASGVNSIASTGRAGLTTPRLRNLERPAGQEGCPQPVFLAEVLDDDSVIEFYEDFAKLAFGDSRGSVNTLCRLLKYQTKDMAAKDGMNKPDTHVKVEDGGGVHAGMKRKEMHSSNGSGLQTSPYGMLGGRLTNIEGEQGIGRLEKDGKVKCTYCWTVKRDVFDIPMMIILNFLPCI